MNKICELKLCSNAEQQENNVKYMFDIIQKFQLTDRPMTLYQYGNGYINETYIIKCKKEKQYILQKINKNIFKNPAIVMENIEIICAHISQKVKNPRKVLNIVKTIENTTYYKDDMGEYWRIYDYITRSLCLEYIEYKNDFYECAIGFGNFIDMLIDIDVSKIKETIEKFHNIHDRYDKLKNAVKKDLFNRVKKVEREIEFALNNEKKASVLQNMITDNVLPLRITHNDTKINNILLDIDTRKALCVIDLDTVMPGIIAYDFGDAIRFGMNNKNEQKSSEIYFNFNLYELFLEGFLYACGKNLSRIEIESLPESVRVMLIESGIRYLTDYLNGDVYFKIKYPEQNIIKCKNQFKLINEINIKWDKH